MARAMRLGGGERAVGERAVVLSLSGMHALIHSTELAYAALLLRIEAEFGTDLLLLGVLANVSAFAFGLGALPAGLLADRLGSVHVLRITLAGSTIAAMLVALSPSELALGVTLALLGITTGLYHPAGFALLARTRRRTRNVALHGVVGTLGIAGRAGAVVRHRAGDRLAAVIRGTGRCWRPWASSTRCDCRAAAGCRWGRDRTALRRLGAGSRRRGRSLPPPHCRAPTPRTARPPATTAAIAAPLLVAAPGGGSTWRT